MALVSPIDQAQDHLKETKGWFSGLYNNPKSLCTK